ANNGAMDEDGGSVTVSYNAADIDGTIVSTVATVPAEQGTVTTNETDGTITFTPAANFNGEATITLVTTDDDGATATTTSTVTVGDVNDGPTITANNGAMDEDGGSVTVSYNAADIDGTIVSTVATVPAEQGTVTVNETDGTITFTPVANFNGEATITLVTTDDDGATATTTSTVTVGDVNDGPTINANNGTMDEDGGSLTVSYNAADIDGTIVSTVATVPADQGTVTVNETDGTITFTPVANFNGEATITLVTTDDDGATATTTSTISVGAVNDATLPVADTATTTEDAPVDISVLANDTDVDGNPATLVSATNGASGTTSVNVATGVVTYTPNADFNGTDTFTYTNSEGNSETVTVTVNPENDPTVLVADTATTQEDNAVDIAVLANDTDADGNPATLVSATNGANGTTSVNVATGVVTYTPNADFNGTDTFTYENSEGNTETVTVTVGAVNDAPTFAGDAVGAVLEDGTDPILTDTGTLTISDADTGENVFQTTGITASAGALGSLSITEAGEWTYNVANADVQYLALDEEKVETFTVLSADGTTHDVVVTITGTNDLPTIAGDDIGAVTEDDADPTLTDTGTLTISDADTGENVFQTTGITASAGALGSLSISEAGEWTYNVANADVQYLALDEEKVETFTVLSADGTTHDVVVTITGTNDLP
ncbi:Ig-like domain-containing protein, partial [Colwelliaceae bacterium BS250]